jgi:LPXTG-motif cell wall-anchored protein
MKQNGTQDILKNKALVIIICMVGIVAVSYGMVRDNDVFFIIGIMLIIGGYLLIRRRIKAHIRNNP